MARQPADVAGGDVMTPTREVYWHISGVWLMYLLLVPTLAVFGAGLYRHWRIWMAGQPVDRSGDRAARWRLVWSQVVGHRRLLADSVAGRIHLGFFWGMAFLFAATVVVFVHQDLRIPIMRGWFYLVFQSFLVDIAGALLVLALVVALARRYVTRVPRLQHNREGARPDATDWISLWSILLICLQGFTLEAIRIAANPDPWVAWSPVGYLLSRPVTRLALYTQIAAYQVTWWAHLVTVFAWIAWLPFSKLVHVFTSPLSVYYADLKPAGMALEPIDFEKAERLGTLTLSDLTWKDRLDLDACTSCGRCQDACPAYAAGLPLSPKNLILDLRDHMHRVEMPRSPKELFLGRTPSAADAARALPGDVVRPESLWACTTCRACMEACPVSIEHVPKIVSMRRYLVMEQADTPDGVAEALRSLEARGHPYKGTTATRTGWCDGLDVPVMADVKETDVLFWVGCTAAFDPRNQKVARALVAVMRRADVRFAILGPEEQCTGDPVRRMGQEFLYDTVARQNVERLKRYRFRRIVTGCPHCLNALGNEYRQFGGDFRVVHHTQLLHELVREGKLDLPREAAATVTYHDPCYLGRYNSEYDAPRELVAAAGGGLREMARCRETSFCCGAGGGQAWMETVGTRVNQLRAREAAATGAEIVATACPFCLQMMEDGLKTQAPERGIAVRDVVELVAAALERRPFRV